MKSAFRYLFFVLVTLASVPMLGQRSNILYGKVTDSATREPLIGATVAVDGAVRWAVSVVVHEAIRDDINALCGEVT